MISTTCLGIAAVGGEEMSLRLEQSGRWGQTVNYTLKKRKRKKRKRPRKTLTKNIINVILIFIITKIQTTIRLMIPIKEHNDIVQKLMKQLSFRDQQLKAALKEKTKLPSQTPQLQPTKNEQQLNKKIGQLTKEHKERVNSLTQQIKNQEGEIKELKERLTTKMNIEAKEKQHIAQILKKTYDRKPSSGADYKISALVTHYDAEIQKKNKYIDSLNKKIKELETSSSLKSTTYDGGSNENFKTVVNETEEGKGISATEYTKETNRLRGQGQKWKKLFQEKDKEYKNLARRYSELTNQYYKIINSYGIEQQRMTQKNQQITINQTKSKNDPKPNKKTKTNALQNLLHQMACSQSQPEEIILNKRNFASKVASLEAQGTYLQQETFKEEEEEEIEQKNNYSPSNYGASEGLQTTAASMKLQEIMEELSLQDPDDIVPTLIKIKTSFEQFTLVDTIARSLQVFFCNIGKGKLTKKQLIPALEDLQIGYSKVLQAVDILDSVCIEAGAKREKLQGRIIQLTKTNREYYQKLKSIKFMQEVAKGTKILEFIQFFDLDKEELLLPQQLLNIQDQLKSIDKFLKEARIILEIGVENSSQEVLGLILRYLEKTTSLVSQLEKKKSKTKVKQVE